MAYIRTAAEQFAAVPFYSGRIFRPNCAERSFRHTQSMAENFVLSFDPKSLAQIVGSFGPTVQNEAFGIHKVLLKTSFFHLSRNLSSRLRIGSFGPTVQNEASGIHKVWPKASFFHLTRNLSPRLWDLSVQLCRTKLPAYTKYGRKLRSFI